MWTDSVTQGSASALYMDRWLVLDRVLQCCCSLNVDECLVTVRQKANFLNVDGCLV